MLNPLSYQCSSVNLDKAAHNDRAPDKKGNRDNLEIILHENIHCDPSLEPSHRDGSNERSHCMFSLRNKKNYIRIILGFVISK